MSELIKIAARLARREGLPDDTPASVFNWLGAESIAIRNEADKQRALIETQQAALKALDDWWTEEFPGGPDDPKNSKGFIVLSDDTLDIWRKVRAALTAAKEITQ